MDRLIVVAGGVLCLFVLTASLMQVPQAAGAGAPAAQELKNPFEGNAGAMKEGEKLFDERCADCHGSDAMGGAGPDLTDDKWFYGGSDGDLFATVSGGRKGGMPSWKGQLTDDEIWKVIAYVRSLKKK